MQTDEYYGNERREMLPFVPAEARRILDVGCGRGSFGAALKERLSSAEVWGIEMNSTAATEARQVLDEILSGDALEVLAELPTAHFDCIVLNDVLEHVPQPEELITLARSRLGPEGRIVASIPNVRYFFNVVDLACFGRWDYTDEGILDRTHLRFFTRSTILRLFAEGGFSVERIEGINPTGSLKFSIANLLSLGRFSEMRYLQYAVVARRTGED